MDLQTRLVFIDTCAYENKNYQFGEHALAKLEKLLDENKLQLLITEITKKEIEAHLWKKSAKAIKELKEYINDAGKILRATSELPINVIFKKTTKEEIFNSINFKLQEFLSYPCVETVSVKDVNPELIFNKYFAKEPPFITEEKKNEFPDAFVLEAIKNLASSRELKVYIVSSDGDMKAYAEQNENCIHLNSIDELIDLVLRNDEELLEPITFADSIFLMLEKQIIRRAENILKESQFEAEFDGYDFLDNDIHDVHLDKVLIVNKTLLDVAQDSVEYELEFQVDLTATYILPDYDSSPWDPEDKVYAFIRKNEIIKSHKQYYTANIEITYSEGIREHDDIFNFQFHDAIFILNEENSQVIKTTPIFD